MKRFWWIALFATLLFASNAVAEVYTVKNRDTLSDIAKRHGVTIGAIQQSNPKIKNINRIQVGWKLEIPAHKVFIKKAKVAKKFKALKAAKVLAPVDIYVPGQVGIRQGVYSRPGSAPTKMSNNKAWGLILLSDSVKEKISKAFIDKKGEDSFIEPGDQFLMTYGSGGVMDATLKYDGLIYAIRYLIQDGGVIHDIRYIPWCHNWTRHREIIPPKEKVALPKNEIPIPVPSTEWKIPSEEIVPPEEDIPSLEEDFTDTFEYIPPLEREWTIEHEPILGAFYLGNDLGESYGFYGEYMAWLRRGQDYIFENGWSPGAGIYGIYSEFDSRIGSYQGREGSIGPQLGIKYIGYGANPFNFQLKGRLVWEDMSGGTAEGYHMEQDGLKAGVYTEATKKLDEKWLVGIIGEYWWDISSSRTSTWSGDTPSERGMYSVDLFGQYKISEDWSARASAGIFHQEWDDLTGIHARLEARWKNTLMFGPYAAWYPFGLSEAYEGFSAGDLTSYGAFVRVEFGEPIRKHYADKRMARVKAADREWLDELLRTKFQQ